MSVTSSSCEYRAKWWRPKLMTQPETVRRQKVRNGDQMRQGVFLSKRHAASTTVGLSLVRLLYLVHRTPHSQYWPSYCKGHQSHTHYLVYRTTFHNDLPQKFSHTVWTSEKRGVSTEHPNKSENICELRMLERQHHRLVIHPLRRWSV